MLGEWLDHYDPEILTYHHNFNQICWITSTPPVLGFCSKYISATLQVPIMITQNKVGHDKPLLFSCLKCQTFCNLAKKLPSTSKLFLVLFYEAILLNLVPPLS